MTITGPKLGLALATTLLVCSAGLAHAQGPAAPPTLPSPPSFAPGELVPGFDATAINGSARHVDYPAKSATVLLFFMSSCPTCHKMIPEWNRAFERRPKGLQVLGVLLDREAPGFFEATPIAFPVLRAPSRELVQKEFKVQRVPVTMRVGPRGMVEDVALGVVDAIRLGQLFRPVGKP
jgi:hypothetical protein